MPKNKALVYAEDILGVHDVYQKALSARENLDGIFTDLDALFTQRRVLQDQIGLREVDVTIEQQNTHPDSTQAALDRLSKTARTHDATLIKLRAELNQVESDIEGRKYDRSIAEHDINIATARMIELGGYFAYLVQMKEQAAPAADEAN